MITTTQNTGICFATPKESRFIGCWNVRTMYSVGKAAQFVREMKQNHCEILGISEVRWTGFGRIELNTGESCIFSGREDNIHRAGVGLMMSKEASKALMEWKPVNKRIITARLFSKYIKTSVIQVYAPTEDAEEEDKENFYEQLQATFNQLPTHYVKLIMGDLNAKVGADPSGFGDIMGNHGVGERNDNGLLLLSFCEFNNLVVTGTIFPHRAIHKATWVSPAGQTQNQIDHVIISRQHRTSLLDTRVQRGADVASDHYLVRTKIQLKLRSCKVIRSSRSRYNTSLLKYPGTKKHFCITLKNKFQALQDMDEPDEVTSDGTEADDSSNYREEETANTRVHRKWATFKSSFQKTAEEVLGRKEKSHKPWISHNLWATIDDRKKLKQKIEVTKSERIKDQLRKDYKEKDKETKRSIRRDKRKWIADLIREAEEAANKGQMKIIYDVTKIVCNCKSRLSQAVGDKSGQLLTSEDAKRERWRQHFEETLNRNKPSAPLDIQEDECIPELAAISQEPINKEEIKVALKSMKSGKAPGRDSITAELLTVDKDLAAEWKTL